MPVIKNQVIADPSLAALTAPIAVPSPSPKPTAPEIEDVPAEPSKKKLAEQSVSFDFV